MSFSLFIRIFFVCLLILSAVVGRRVIIWLQAFAATPAQKRRVRIISWALLFILNTPALYMIAQGVRTHGSTHQAWQLYFLYPYFAWQVSALVLGVLLAVKGILAAPVRLRAWLRRRKHQERPVSESRRAFLARGATALPAGLLLSTGYGIHRAQNSFDWFEHDLKLRDWPSELQGFRVMQISDLHVGSFMPGKKLNAYVDAINERPADMVMITGDIIDHNISWLPDCLEGLRRLKIPRYGAYVCIGNHDYYSGGAEQILAGVTALGMQVVRDSHVVAPVGNSRIVVAGIDYPLRRNAVPGTEDRFEGHVDAALAGAPPDAPKILLAHHPHAFDDAAARGVPLTLSGHTHGGQFAFRYPGGSISLGDLMFKYVAGVYRHRDAYLYVNRGIGNWFPMRVGAPPEVTLLTLG